jgi:AcrR family transcriptional regulator
MVQGRPREGKSLRPTRRPDGTPTLRPVSPKPPARRPPRRAGPGSGRTLTRAWVVGVAAEIADREGFTAVTLSRVARELECHVTSLYTHVDSVDGLRRQVARLAQEELAEQLWRAALGKARTDALRALSEVYRSYTHEHPGRSEALRGADRDRETDPEWVAGSQRIAEPIRAVLGSFGLDERQVIHAHRAFSAAIRGFAAGEASDLYIAGDVDETFRQIVELFVQALEGGTWPAPVPVPEPARRSRRAG